jgi:hypothetical protein
MQCTSCKKDEKIEFTKWQLAKRWLLRQFFPQEVIDTHHGAALQGFSEGYKIGIEQQKEANKATIEALRGEIARLQGSWKTDWFIDQDNIVSLADTATGKLLTLAGEKIDENAKKQLQVEVKALENFRLWQVLQASLKQAAIDKSVNASKGWEEVLAGKMMLKNLEIMNNIIKVIASTK